jgi:predicted dehydrogenase
MEAMHTRFHPRTQVLLALLADNALGEVRSVHADVGVHFAVDPASRLYDPALGGGALLDLGVYAMWFAHLILGRPDSIVTTGLRTATGVDAQSATVLRAGSAQGLVTTTLRSLTPTGASVTGSVARIDWDARMPQPGGFTLVDTATRESLRFDDTTGIQMQHGMCRQAVWMARHVADGLLQAPGHPLSASIDVLAIIDSARAQLVDAPIVRD